MIQMVEDHKLDHGEWLEKQVAYYQKLEKHAIKNVKWAENHVKSCKESLEFAKEQVAYWKGQVAKLRKKKEDSK